MNRCAVHRWYVPRYPIDGEQNITLATCLNPGCGARQYQSLDSRWDTTKRANQLNARDGYPLIKMPGQKPKWNNETIKSHEEEKQMVATINAAELHPGTLAKLGISRTSIKPPASKYDNLLPQILEDLKTMHLAEVERKHKIGLNSLSSILGRWKKRGLIPADYEPPCKKQTHVEKKPARAAAPPLPPETPAGPEKPTTETAASGNKLNVMVHLNFPTWNEAWGDAVKVAWLQEVGELMQIGVSK